ncbi:MAG: rhomboid family intramembrane serine protease [Thermoprotei archaeon]|nr:MAG: rhomboid family intramembrane serine protease [Thermoprotei archaeon]RLF23818.1 MAG: rhomboid family intramembrane serine protease [Thermoprotei archaeon]
MIPIGDEYRPRRFPVINYALIAINVVVFFYFFLKGFRPFIRAILTYGMIPLFIVNGERLWTLITSMFMHGSIDHLLGNMLFLYIFGDNIEDAYGHMKYLLFYIITGILASFTHILTLPPIPEAWRVPAVGASGAISGVLGAYMVLFPYVRVRVLVFTWWGLMITRVPAYWFLGLWFLYQLYAGTYALLGVSSGIAFWAHIGGFIAGMLIAYVTKGRRRRRVVYRYYVYYPTYP